MKNGLDDVSLANFVGAARGAVERSGARLEDVSYLCGIHMKRSMHDAIVDALGIDPARVSYLDDTGHMSGVDPLLGLDRAVRAGDVGDGRSRRAAGGRHGLHVGGDGAAVGSRRVSAFSQLAGSELGPTSWREVTQARIDAFAVATDDPQWIHTDPERAAAGPFGSTIAHGFLTLSLCVPMLYEVLPRRTGWS